MEAKCSDFIMKIWGAGALLTIMMAMAVSDKFSKYAKLGTAIELHCPPERYNLTVWKVNFNNGQHCHLSFKRENNTIARNCNMDFIDWVSRPEEDSAVQIKSFQMSSEGIYRCFIATAKGTLSHEYEVSLSVSPQVSLTHANGTAVCKAAAGKPAAGISWNPPGDSQIVIEILPNDTKTVISTYNMKNVNEDKLTCIISHPTGGKSLILTLSVFSDINEKKESSTMIILYSCLTGLLGILGFSLSIYLWRFCGSKRKIPATTNIETVSEQTIQENDVEPYAIFVQVENVLYDKACNFSSGYDLSSST
ncbi:cell surface glycoprotein CD200 receptor 1 isoform X2 [Thamnophis elegans]|uniref:cell surface glycoprotein CD200 receptor 1 isoform X2 n=1 Tax=Thamnophis elegans TaxID=35005 RepID=UPI00137776F2|nr:cell surface glycoprotein CD200 receptor 1 isoform X2 [Thamnophis elegans]